MKNKEVEGLLLKVAEMEVIIISLLSMLDAKQLLTEEETISIFGIAEIPEILSARIELIKKQGEGMIEARKKIFSEILNTSPITTGDGILPEYKGMIVISDTEEIAPFKEEKDPNRKLH